MKVKELEASMMGRNELRIATTLGEIDIADDASSITVNDQPFMLDEQATSLFGKYLKIPTPYLKSCPVDFRATTMRYWRDKWSEAETVVEGIGNNLVSIYPRGLLMLPLDEVVDMVTRVFLPEDDVRDFRRDDKTFHLDVSSDRYQVDVPNPNGIPGRPEVGDITAGGVRFLVYPNQVKAPVVSTYLCRLACTNGMTTDLKQGQIKLKGRTIEEVLDEMECAAEQVLGTLDRQLESYAATAEIAPPGSPLAFAMQLAREVGLPVRVRNTIMDLINQLPSNASVYDVTQCFTTVANQGVKYSTQLALQQLGGRLSFDTAETIRRCQTCEQLLVS
ncbi:hypothetical protein [Mycolicibacter kumamotonensis]|uniref:DUF932 domain-containing protein n=1 Tax=Mycolicibacter kumamotonensis TaxID=354243 RepID=A0A1B8SLA7_9MYCO|nr:hypothetical protein [Mycolicibacter kumamotonensis]OBY33484.1 hypothetical protein ACT18_00615 [Mycolicibacter kumamotonensis]